MKKIERVIDESTMYRTRRTVIIWSQPSLQKRIVASKIAKMQIIIAHPATLD